MFKNEHQITFFFFKIKWKWIGYIYIAPVYPFLFNSYPSPLTSLLIFKIRAHLIMNSYVFYVNKQA